MRERAPAAENGRSVLVTGAGGFVGSAVVRRFVRALSDPSRLFADGAPVEQVIGLVRPGGSLERLEELPADLAWSVAEVDLRDAGAVSQLVGRLRPRAIVHAGLDPATFQDLPRNGSPLNAATLNALIGGLSGVSGARFVHVGSHWVLAPGLHLDERALVAPASVYAENKAREDRLVPALAERAGVPWINLRLFNVFGRYEKLSRLLPHLVGRLSQGAVATVSHGDQVRDFTDVDAVADAFLRALQAPESACGSIYHVGSGRATTVREFAFAVARTTGNPDLIQFGTRETQDQNLPILVANPDRTRRSLGWTPPTDLLADIQTAAQWWLARTHRRLVE